MRDHKQSALKRKRIDDRTDQAERNHRRGQHEERKRSAVSEHGPCQEGGRNRHQRKGDGVVRGRPRRAQPDQREQRKHGGSGERGLEQCGHLSVENVLRVCKRLSRGDNQEQRERESGDGYGGKMHRARDQEVGDLRRLRARTFPNALDGCALKVDAPQRFAVRSAHLRLEPQSTIADLGSQRAYASRQSQCAAQQFQRLIALDAQVLRQFLVSFRNGLDASDEIGRGVACARGLQPLRHVCVVRGEPIEVGVEGVRLPVEHFDRRGQPAIGRPKHRREVRQSKQFFDEIERNFGGRLHGGERPLVSVDLGALLVEPRGIGEPLADIARGRLERLERRDDLGKRRECRLRRRRRALRAGGRR
ncbi:MAG TPA: hypothetical protein VFJ68_00970 [Casimicrobiaceae bacterium]|nr:hypothetical protein [Casimicrobiaceae bacterium]